jgi:hypothetical protein
VTDTRERASALSLVVYSSFAAEDTTLDGGYNSFPFLNDRVLELPDHTYVRAGQRQVLCQRHVKEFTVVVDSKLFNQVSQSTVHPNFFRRMV